jgi:hypothetical protein
MLPKKPDKIKENLERILDDIVKKPYNFHHIKIYSTENIKIEIAYLKEQKLYFSRINYEKDDKNLGSIIDFLKKHYKTEFEESYSEVYMELILKNNKKEAEESNKEFLEGLSEDLFKKNIKEKNKKTFFIYENIIETFLEKREQKKDKIEQEIHVQLPEKIFLNYERDFPARRINKIRGIYNMKDIYDANNILIEFKDSKERTKNFLCSVISLLETS